MFGAAPFAAFPFAGADLVAEPAVSSTGAGIFRRDPIRRRKAVARASAGIVVSVYASGVAVGDSDEDVLTLLLGAVN